MCRTSRLSYHVTYPSPVDAARTSHDVAVMGYFVGVDVYVAVGCDAGG